jgi:hypothetical protein
MTEKCYQITIDPDLRVIAISFQGKVYPKDMIDLLEDLFQRDEYNPSYSTLYDFSGSTAIGYQMDIGPFVKRLRELRKADAVQKKVAIIVKTPNQKFLINLFLKFAPSFNLEIEVFDETDAAVKWVKEDSEIQRKVASLLEKNRQELIKRLIP